MADGARNIPDFSDLLRTPASPSIDPIPGNNPFHANDSSSPVADAIWILISTFIIFTMHSGFALLESGFVQKKNETNVLVKNLVTVILSGISFWFLGYGFVYGDESGTNSFVGVGHFVFDANLKDEAHSYAHFFIQLPFAITATHIVSGAVTERINMKAFMAYALLNTAFIYVFPAHWMWGPKGWLADFGAYDFAGAGVVHMCGGAAAFAGALLLGPRHGKYGPKKRDLRQSKPMNIVLGTFMLWWGWIGFNSGSTLGVNASMWKLASRAAVVTMNGGLAGGMASCVIAFIDSYKKKQFFLDVGMMVSGVLGGLVGITAIASICKPWEALVIGFIGGFVANGVIALLEYLHIDDPVGAVGVHWGAGCWSMISVGLFAHIDPIAGFVSREGIFRGGNGHLLGAQLLACLVITLWSAGLSAILFIIMNFTIGFRAPLEEEIAGFDHIEHGIPYDDDIIDQSEATMAVHVISEKKYDRSLLKRKEKPTAVEESEKTKATEEVEVNIVEG